MAGSRQARRHPAKPRPVQADTKNQVREFMAQAVRDRRTVALATGIIAHVRSNSSFIALDMDLQHAIVSFLNLGQPQQRASGGLIRPDGRPLVVPDTGGTIVSDKELSS